MILKSPWQRRKCVHCGSRDVKVLMKRSGVYRAWWTVSMSLIAAFLPVALAVRPLFAAWPVEAYPLALAVLGHVLFIPAIVIQTYIHSPDVAILKCMNCEKEFPFF